MLRVLFAIIAGAVVSVALAQPLPPADARIAAPEDSTVERLGDTLVVNGRPMSIQHVTTTLPAADVLRHYRKMLDRGANGKFVQTQVAGDEVLARRIGHQFVTVRIRSTPGGTADVWVMTTPMNPPPAGHALPPHLALPAGSQVLSSVETVDGGRRAYTVIATADAALIATQDFLKRSLGERGFTLVASDTSGNDSSRRVLLFQRDTEDVMVTIADGPAGRTMVLNASGPK